MEKCVRAAKVCWEHPSLIGQETTGVQSNWSRGLAYKQMPPDSLQPWSFWDNNVSQIDGGGCGERRGSTRAWCWEPLLSACMYAVS